MENTEWVTINEAAERLGVDYHLAYSWVRRGQLLALPCSVYGRESENGERLVRWGEAVQRFRATTRSGKAAQALQQAREVLVAAVLVCARREGDLGAATETLDRLDRWLDRCAEVGVNELQATQRLMDGLQRAAVEYAGYTWRDRNVADILSRAVELAHDEQQN